MKVLKGQKRLGLSAVILLVSGFICKCLGALFRLPLTNLVGIEGIGIFQLIMSLYAFALVVTCGGVTNSLSKLISTARAKREYEKVTIYLKRALGVSVSIGLAIGVLFVLCGNWICALQGIGLNLSYKIFVVILPLGAGLATFRGFFQGYENMFPTATSQIVEQVFKFAFGLLFAFWFGKSGVNAGVFGAFLGITFSEIVPLSYLLVIYAIKNKKKDSLTDLSQIKFAKNEFDKANFPLTFSASILPLVNAFDGMIIVPRLLKAGLSSGAATKLFGLQAGVVGAILNFPLIISVAVTTTLLPNISYLISRGSGGKKTIEKGLKILLFLILPITFGVVAISKQALELVYTDMSGAILETAFSLMFYGGFAIVFTALMQYLTMVLQANGEFRYILAITLLGGGTKAILSFFLSAVPTINIYALVLGNISLSAIVCLLALAKLKRIVPFVVSFADMFTLIFATVAMFLTVYTFINANYFSLIPNILLAVAIGVVVYFVFTLPFSYKLGFLRKTSKISQI